MDVDFHIHSIYSDGTFFPKEILNLANEKQLNFFSIADHDCVPPVLEDNRFISGIEISTEQEIFGEKISAHVLGYGFDVEKMRDKIEPFRKNKIDKLEFCVENFNKFDFKSNLFSLKEKRKTSLKEFFEFKLKRRLSDEEFVNFKNKFSPSRLDFAEFLCKNFFKYNENLQELYGDVFKLFKSEFSDTIFKKNKHYKKPTLFEAIEIIKDCNGLAVLAHPGFYRFISERIKDDSEKDIEKFISLLKNKGLDGIEIYNYSGVARFSKEATENINNYFIDLSKKFNLLNTWGSDCHGNQWWGIQIGNFGAKKEDVSEILTRLNKYI